MTGEPSPPNHQPPSLNLLSARRTLVSLFVSSLLRPPQFDCPLRILPALFPQATLETLPPASSALNPHCTVIVRGLTETRHLQSVVRVTENMIGLVPQLTVHWDSGVACLQLNDPKIAQSAVKVLNGKVLATLTSHSHPYPTSAAVLAAEAAVLATVPPACSYAALSLLLCAVPTQLGTVPYHWCLDACMAVGLVLLCGGNLMVNRQ